MPLASGKEYLRKVLSLLFSGRISDAERVLGNLKKKLDKEEGDGYYDAIYGIYYSYVNDDAETLTFKLWTDEFIRKNRKRVVEEFRAKSKSRFSELPGFYKAWADLVEILNKLPKPHKLVKDEGAS